MRLIFCLVLTSVCVHLSLSYVRWPRSPSIQHIPRQFIDYELTPESRNGFFNQFQSFVEGIIEDATNFIKEYAEKSADIMAQIQSHVAGIEALCRDTANKFKKEVDDLINAWNTTSANAMNCTQHYTPMIAEVVFTFNASMSDCIQNATASAQEIQNAIRPNIEQLLTYVKQLETLVSDCFDNSTNIFQGISCVLGQGNTIKTNVLQSVTEIKTIVVTSTTKGFKIVTNAGKCMNAALDIYQRDTQDLQRQMKNCILDGFWN